MIVGEIYLADPKNAAEDGLFGRFGLLDEKGSIDHDGEHELFENDTIVCISDLVAKHYTIHPFGQIFRQTVKEQGYICINKGVLIFIEMRHVDKFIHIIFN
jgi:hypothetical protein